MTSQVVFNIDSELKQKAMQKAKKDGIPMKTLLNLFLKGYIEEDFNLIIGKRRKYDVEDIEVNEYLQKKMNNLSKLI